MTSFERYIRTERKKRDWTQAEFGKLIDIPVRAIGRIENGHLKFSKSKLKKLAELFQAENQIITDLYYADKFAHEAIKYKCSDSIFIIAEGIANFAKDKNI